ncbi:hypothetical protein SMD11_0957 [Streptomyces albireticuli]|uniref:Uncharacterized protein n=1 Tax=Streptomyces albireticuli TaxID=1940 RepID=A0A1Z2KX50_9ACTN|nr:hypothetical protein SMD11_0957 [Streptomyces albireticuli]
MTAAGPGAPAPGPAHRNHAAHAAKSVPANGEQIIEFRERDRILDSDAFHVPIRSRPLEVSR